MGINPGKFYTAQYSTKCPYWHWRHGGEPSEVGRRCILSDKWHASCDHDQNRFITISTNVALLPVTVYNTSNEHCSWHPQLSSYSSVCSALHWSTTNKEITLRKTLIQGRNATVLTRTINALEQISKRKTDTIVLMVRKRHLLYWNRRFVTVSQDQEWPVESNRNTHIFSVRSFWIEFSFLKTGFPIASSV
jgi:hypothetical protein